MDPDCSEACANDQYDYDSDTGLEYPKDALGSLHVEKVLKSGYLKKKGEKRKVSLRSRFVCILLIKKQVDVEEALVCSSDDPPCLLQE